MKKLSLIGAAAVAAVLASAPAKAEPPKVEILMSPSGSGPYLAWATFQNYAPKYTDKMAPVAVETPGFTYNVRFLAQTPDKWKTTVIGSGEVVEWAAAEGVKPFFPKPMAVAKDFRVLGSMSQTSNVFVTLDPDIKVPADFAGKRVAVGLLTQNEWGMHQRMMLDTWGITPKLKSFDALGPGQNIDALLDGRSDVGTLVVHSSLNFAYNLEPGPFKKLESAQRPWFYVDVPKPTIESYIKDTGAPFMIREVKANTFSNQPKAITTFGNHTLLSVHKSFPDDLAYEFVKTWLKMGPEIGKYSAIGQIWNPETIGAVAKIAPERLHPGARRAYIEAGLLKE
ncbi:MAG: hypothetical protein CMM61_14330 [Rhodospirillaceae bacterium]|nr:hypothetical protein [Rhodospirillaceae bacterium]